MATTCARPGCKKVFVGGAVCCGRRFCSLVCVDIDPALVAAREEYRRAVARRTVREMWVRQ